MVRRVVWTESAIDQLKEILKYWTERNGSNAYSIKLRNGLRHLSRHIAKYPESGVLCENPNFRFRAYRFYEVYYRHTDTEIYIVLIWDGRRNPRDLNPDYLAVQPK
ncbi:MAG: type II toxin-antitoxin system RelE/ParE family toxin [Bacteroidia bacterium]